eukprot:6170962-Alexandrium_andersonii.AAC.1
MSGDRRIADWSASSRRRDFGPPSIPVFVRRCTTIPQNAPLGSFRGLFEEISGRAIQAPEFA